MNTFAEIERAKADLLREKDKRTAEHQSWLAAYEAHISELIQRTSLLTQGVDVMRIDRACKVLRVSGDSTKAVLDRDGTHGRDTRPNAIAYAKQLLAESPAKLKEKYIGVKNYDSFGDQREDHRYGMGPRHGNIVFSIGLTEDARKRDLTAEEIEDALYLLHVLDHGSINFDLILIRSR